MLQLLPKFCSLVLHLIVGAHQLNKIGGWHVIGKFYIVNKKDVASDFVQKFLHIGRVE